MQCRAKMTIDGEDIEVTGRYENGEWRFPVTKAGTITSVVVFQGLPEKSVSEIISDWDVWLRRRARDHGPAWKQKLEEFEVIVANVSKL